MFMQDAHREHGADKSFPARLLLSLFCSTAACSFPRPADVPEPISCTANEFFECDGNGLQTCNGTGDGAVTQDCGVAGCNAAAKRCNQCVPSTDSCGAGTSAIDHCGPDGLPASQDGCALGCVAIPKAHCSFLEPRYLPDVCEAAAAAPSFVVSNLANFDTGLDNNCQSKACRIAWPPPLANRKSRMGLCVALRAAAVVSG